MGVLARDREVFATIHDESSQGTAGQTTTSVRSLLLSGFESTQAEFHGYVIEFSGEGVLRRLCLGKRLVMGSEGSGQAEIGRMRL